MIIVGLSNSLPVAGLMARKLRAPWFAVEKNHFPDGEIYMRFSKNVKDQHVVLVQSFHPYPQEALIEIVWAAAQSRAQGAKSVVLAAPYLGYVRQDKEFHSGEAVSVRILAGLLSRYVDRIVTIDPHLHRIKDLETVFACPVKVVTANGLLADFIKKNYVGCVVVGPDEESEQWAAAIARSIKVESTVLVKTRFSSQRVRVKLKGDIDVKGKIVVIVDDIISSGKTIAEAAKLMKKFGPKRVVTVSVHGVFAGKAIFWMKKAGVREITSSTTIESAYAKIDVAELLANAVELQFT